MIEPESDEQTKILQELEKQDKFNKKMFDEQAVVKLMTQGGTDEFYKFQSDLLESNGYFN